MLTFDSRKTDLQVSAAIDGFGFRANETYGRSTRTDERPERWLKNHSSLSIRSAAWKEPLGHAGYDVRQVARAGHRWSVPAPKSAQLGIFVRLLSVLDRFCVSQHRSGSEPDFWLIRTPHHRITTLFVGCSAAWHSMSSALLPHLCQYLVSVHPLLNLHFNPASGFNEDRKSLVSDCDLELFAPEDATDRLDVTLVPVADGSKSRVVVQRGSVFLRVTLLFTQR